MKFILSFLFLIACFSLQAAPVYEIVKVEETLNSTTKNIASVEVVITVTEGDFSMAFHKKLNAEELTAYKADKSTIKAVSVQLAVESEVPFLARKGANAPATPFVSEKKDVISALDETTISQSEIDAAKSN